MLMNKVVKYDNYMNSLSFKKFKSVELDLLMTLCNRLRDKGVNSVTFPFSELKNLSGDTKHSNKEFIDSLKNMNRKLMEITCEVEFDGKIIMFVLFPTFEIDIRKETLTICVNERFKFILNELTKNFTRFDLKDFVSLGSKYSKNLFKILKQFRTTGIYETNINDFRDRMGCPESYSNKYVMDLIIKPSLNELKNYFQNLECETKYARKRGKPVTGYIFTFAPENRSSDQTQDKMKSPVQNQKPKQNGFANFQQREYDYDSLEKELLNKQDQSKVVNLDIEKELRNIKD